MEAADKYIISWGVVLEFQVGMDLKVFIKFSSIGARKRYGKGFGKENCGVLM